MHGHGPTRRRGARNRGVVTAPGAAIIAVPPVRPDDVVIDCPRHTRHFVLAGDGIALAAGLRLVNGRDAAGEGPDGGRRRLRACRRRERRRCQLLARQLHCRAPRRRHRRQRYRRRRKRRRQRCGLSLAAVDMDYSRRGSKTPLEFSLYSFPQVA